MSHFTLLVVGAETEEQVEKMLDPFWELDLSQEEMIGDYRAVFDIKFTDKEAKKAFQEFKSKCPTNEQIKYAHQNLLRPRPILTKIDSICNKDKVESINKGEFEKWCKNYGLDGFYVTQKMNKNYYKSIAEWMDNYHGYYYSEEEGGWGYYHNPNAKWDWFQIGGRWAGYFRLKEGYKGKKGEPTLLIKEEKRQQILTEPLTADMARIEDIDFEGMELENKVRAEKNWAEYKKKMKKDAKNCHPYFEFGVEKDDTKKSYVKRQTSFGTFSVLKDGEWYQKGEMGWWGMAANEKDDDIWQDEFMKLIKGLSPETMVAIIDCHI